MAKNISLIKFTGKLGELSAKNSKYGNILFTPGGFKGERIKTEARYEVTRQLGTEFGRCSKISSQLYSCLQFYLQTIPHLHMYGSVQSLVTTIKGCDISSPKGERFFGGGLQTEEGKRLLKGFSFNPKRSLTSFLVSSYSLVLDRGTFVVEDFDAGKASFPKGAERLGIQLVLLGLDADGILCEMTSSALALIGKDEESAGLKLEAPIPEGKGFLVGMLYFGFCYEVNGSAYFLKSKRNVLEVVGINEIK